MESGRALKTRLKIKVGRVGRPQKAKRRRGRGSRGFPEGKTRRGRIPGKPVIDREL